MNKHPYPDKKTGPLTDLKTGAIWSLTCMRIKCSECGCDPGYYCERTPPLKTAGALRWPPHGSRTAALMKAEPDAGKLQAFSFNDINDILKKLQR